MAGKSSCHISHSTGYKVMTKIISFNSVIIREVGGSLSWQMCCDLWTNWTKLGRQSEHKCDVKKEHHFLQSTFKCPLHHAFSKNKFNIPVLHEIPSVKNTFYLKCFLTEAAYFSTAYWEAKACMTRIQFLEETRDFCLHHYVQTSS
jgi:hypothetical protein